MPSITIECPEAVLLSLHETEAQFARELSAAAAVKLYELGRLSTGRAAELAGLSRTAFFQLLADYKVSLYQGDADDLGQDLANA